MRMIGCVSPVTDGTLSILGLDPARDGVKIRGPARRRPAAGHARHGADRPREHHHLRALLRAPAQGARRAGRRAPRVRRAHRARERQGRAAIGRDEAAPHDRALARQRAGGHAARRADDRARPAGAARRLGPPLPPEAAGRDARSSRRTTWTRPSSSATASSSWITGKIVAEGSPRELIERYSTREVVELRFDDGSRPDDLSYWTDGLVSRVESLPDRVLLYTQDGDAASHGLHERGLVPESVMVRRSTLEDVFLHLTGRSLIE